MAEIDLALWRSRLEQAVSLQTHQHRRWHEAQRMLLGDWTGAYAALTDPDYVPVNYAKAYVSAVVAALYARNPEFFCKARSQRAIGFARSMQVVLNYYKEELNLKAQMKRAITDALITGIAWLEVGYTATFGQLQLQPQDDSGLFNRLLHVTKPPATQGMLNEYVKEIAPYVVRLSPWNVLLAPGYHSVAEMPFLAIAEDLAPEDLAAHPLYGRQFANAAVYPSRRINIPAPAVSTPGMARSMGWGGSNGKLTHMHRLWHCWNRRANQRFIWLDGSQETAGPFPWNVSIEGFPQVEMIFNDLPETNRSAQSYPIGDLTFLMPQLKELNRLRTQMSKHRKRSGGVILAQKAALSDEQARAFQQADDLTLVRMDGAPGTDLTSFVPASLSPDVYRINDRILMDLDLIGQMPFLLPGTMPSGRDTTATRDTLVAQAGGTIRSEKIDVVEQTLQRIGKRLASVIWEYAPRSLIAQILGEDRLPEELWPPLPDDREARRETIERELEFGVEAGSTQPLKDKTLKNEQKIRLLNILGGIAPERIKVTSEGLGQLVDDFEMPELRSWMILDDEAETAAIQQENQLLMQNIPQVVTPNENHALHEQGHAQAMQQGSTPAMDQHLLAHRQFRLQKQPQKPAQAGDGGATRGSAAKPEAQRQGLTDLTDLMGVVGRSQREPGAEKGGVANA